MVGVKKEIHLNARAENCLFESFSMNIYNRGRRLHGFGASR
jgi:hypothetical protein